MASVLKAAQYEPSAPDEHIRGVSALLPVQDQGGFVFMIAYTKKETADAELFLQVMSDQVHRLADSFGKEANPQHRFEQFLGALNETLSSHVRDGRWVVPIEHVHALVGVATQRQMFLSGTGELTALFLHRKPSQRYQIFNLFRGIQTEQSLPTWEKPFAVVLDGDLHPGDVFCICDKDLQRSIPPEELNQLLTTLPPAGAIEKIRQIFPHKESLLLVVIKASNAQTLTASSGRATQSAAGSIGMLEETTDTTARLLEDQRPRISSMLRVVFSWLKARMESRSRILRDINAKDTSMNALKRLGRTTLRILLMIGKLSARQGQATLRNLRDTHQRKKIQERIGGMWHRAKRVPRSTQYLALGIIVAFVALVAGIFVISKSQARAAQERAYQEQILTIEDLMERAAGAVIYQDETQARSLYLNAETLIAQLPMDTPDRATKAAELTSDLQSAMNEIRHLITIPNPPLLADLSQVAEGVVGQAIELANGTLYAMGSDGRVYAYNRTQKRFEVVVSPETLVMPRAASQEDGRTYVLSTDGNISQFLIEEKRLSPAGIGDARWMDLVAYANRLYLLRPTVEGEQGQVVRFDRAGSGFTRETNWITSRTVPLDQAVSLTVDGSVYVLMRNGSIARFDSGSEVGWSAGLVEPAVTDATRIWTDAESRFMYVLEPVSKRLVVYQKDTGAFLVQYRSDVFDDLTDFVVDEKGYTIYLQAGSKLYSIAASHLK